MILCGCKNSLQGRRETLKRFYLLLSLVLIVTLTAGCSSALTASMDSEFTLSIDQSARITSESMIVKFIEVTEDSRCPKGVECIWAGRVSCEVEIVKDGVSNRIILTQTGLTDNTEVYTYQNYTIVSYVLPYPEAGKPIAKSDYRLSLTVTMLGK